MNDLLPQPHPLLHQTNLHLPGSSNHHSNEKGDSPHNLMACSTNHPHPYNLLRGNSSKLHLPGSKVASF